DHRGRGEGHQRAGVAVSLWGRLFSHPVVRMEDGLSHDFRQLRDAIMAWDLKVQAVDTALAKAEDALLRAKLRVRQEASEDPDMNLAVASGYWDGLRVASEILHRRQ